MAPRSLGGITVRWSWTARLRSQRSARVLRNSIKVKPPLSTVHNAVQQALSRECREWGRELMLDAFCERLRHLVAHAARDAATCREKVRQSRQGERA